MFRFTFGLCLFCLLCLSSCEYYNYTYLPSPVSTPGLAKRGDLKVDAAFNPRGGSAEVSYSPINHVGMLVQYNGAFNKDVSNLEGALGYYLKKNEYLFSIFGGAGAGYLANKGSYKELFGYDTWQWNHNSSYSKIYGQLSLGRDIWKVCHLSLGLRISDVTFDSYAYRYKHTRYELHDDHASRGTTISHLEFDTLQITRPAKVLIFDPYVSASFFHTKKFSFNIQANLSLVKSYDQLGEDHSIDPGKVDPGATPGSTVSQAPRRNQPLFIPLSISIGARFNISTRSKKTKTE
jgi:hypothetical protein